MSLVQAARMVVAFWLADHGAPGWLQRLAVGLPMRRKWHRGWDPRLWENYQAAQKASKPSR